MIIVHEASHTIHAECSASMNSCLRMSGAVIVIGALPELDAVVSALIALQKKCLAAHAETAGACTGLEEAKH